MAGLTVTVEADGTITVDGDVDAASLHPLVDAIDSALGPIRIDLARCGYLDSTGIAALVKARYTADASDATFELVGVGNDIRRLFEICGLSEFFGVAAPQPRKPSTCC